MPLPLRTTPSTRSVVICRPALPGGRRSGAEPPALSLFLPTKGSKGSRCAAVELAAAVCAVDFACACSARLGSGAVSQPPWKMLMPPAWRAQASKYRRTPALTGYERYWGLQAPAAQLAEQPMPPRGPPIVLRPTKPLPACLSRPLPGHVSFAQSCVSVPLLARSCANDFPRRQPWRRPESELPSRAPTAS